MAYQAHQLPRGMQREWPGPAPQLQTSFFGGAIALAIVAGVAGRHQILPGRAPAARARHDVVEGEFGSRQGRAAELASVAVAQQNVLARKRAALLRDVPVGEQADHGWNLDRL